MPIEYWQGTLKRKENISWESNRGRYTVKIMWDHLVAVWRIAQCYEQKNVSVGCIKAERRVRLLACLRMRTAEGDETAGLAASNYLINYSFRGD
jgi:hypothetical protein